MKKQDFFNLECCVEWEVLMCCCHMHEIISHLLELNIFQTLESVILTGKLMTRAISMTRQKCWGCTCAAVIIDQKLRLNILPQIFH